MREYASTCVNALGDAKYDLTSLREAGKDIQEPAMQLLRIQNHKVVIDPESAVPPSDIHPRLFRDGRSVHSSAFGDITVSKTIHELHRLKNN